jgi:glucoselysine-6-phosphate deglycase
MPKTETMHDCYLSQFSCLSKLIKNRVELLKGFKDFYTIHKPNRVLLVGSGTSYHACASAAAFMENVLDKEVTVMTPTSIEQVYGRPIVIAVSQGGRSTNTVAAVEMLKAAGVPVVTLSDPADTPVGRAGDLPIHLAADDEQIGPKTRGYAATVFMLCLMALEVTNGKINELEELIQNGQLYFDACDRFLDKHVEALKKARYYLFAGKGASGKAASEAALKVLETICCPAMGYEFEEFLHGPAFCANEFMALFLYLPQGKDRERVLKAAALIGRATENVYIISHEKNLQGDKILYLPCPNPEYLSPVVDVLFAQLISAKLPDLLGVGRHPAVRDLAAEMATKVNA